MNVLWGRIFNDTPPTRPGMSRYEMLALRLTCGLNLLVLTLLCYQNREIG